MWGQANGFDLLAIENSKCDAADNSVFKLYVVPLHTLNLGCNSIIIFTSGLVGASGLKSLIYTYWIVKLKYCFTKLDLTSVNLINDWGVVYSNPIQNSLRFEVKTDVNYNIYDLSDRLVNNGFINGGVNNI